MIATSRHSPPHLGFATTLSPSQSLQQTAPSTMSRLRSLSGSAFPAGLDSRNQFRTISSHANNNHLATPRSGSFSNAFSAGYPSAPLTAPVDFTLTPSHTDANRDFNTPQMSAPIQPSNSFAKAYNSNLKQQSAHRDFGGQLQSTGDGIHHQEDQSQIQHHPRGNEDNNFLRPAEFDGKHQRKRSFTMPGNFETAWMDPRSLRATTLRRYGSMETYPITMSARFSFRNFTFTTINIICITHFCLHPTFSRPLVFATLPLVSHDSSSAFFTEKYLTTFF